MQLQNGSDSVKAPPAGAKAMLIPRNLVNIEDGSSNIPPMWWVNSMSINSAGTISHTVDASTTTRSTNRKFVVDAFSVSGASSRSGYGIRASGGSDFMEINDTTMLGFVTYRATINIRGTWSIPSAVLAISSNYIVFARWNNTSTPICLNRDSNRLEAYAAFGGGGGSSATGTVNGVQIVIVSCGVIPQLPVSGWGMVIRNAAGKVTFSSRYPVLIWRGGVYNMAGNVNWDTSAGQVTRWTSPSGNVSQPMIPLCVIGTQRNNYSHSVNGNDWTPILHSAWMMNTSNNQVTTAQGRATGREMPSSYCPKSVQVGCSLPCIDAADYF